MYCWSKFSLYNILVCNKIINMKYILTKILTLLIIIASLSSKSAFAESWGVLGGVNRFEVVYPNSSSTRDPLLGTVFGAALYPSSNPIEIDILYTSKKITETYSENSLQFPVFYRANITKEFKFGIGAFFDYSLREASYGGQKLDIGVVASLQYQFPMGKSFFVLDARYLYGMADLPGNSRDINLLVGLVFK